MHSFSPLHRFDTTLTSVLLEQEIGRWLPSFSSLRFHGPASERNRLKWELASTHPDLVVTTYEAYTAESSWFKHRRWGLCVLDEGHRIKNHESNAAQALHGIGAQMRIILSGTPLQNNLIERELIRVGLLFRPLAHRGFISTRSVGSPPLPQSSDLHRCHHSPFQGLVQPRSWPLRSGVLEEVAGVARVDYAQEDQGGRQGRVVRPQA